MNGRLGTTPVNRMSRKFRYVNCFRPASVSGMEPSIRLPYKARIVSCWSPPSVSGMEPSIWLSFKFRYVSCWRSPSACGIEPLMLLNAIFLRQPRDPGTQHIMQRSVPHTGSATSAHPTSTRYKSAAHAHHSLPQQQQCVHECTYSFRMCCPSALQVTPRLPLAT